MPSSISAWEGVRYGAWGVLHWVISRSAHALLAQTLRKGRRDGVGETDIEEGPQCQAMYDATSIAWPTVRIRVLLAGG